MEGSLLFILLIILLASVIRSAFGFGDALLAMPLLSFFMSIKTAVPLVAFIGLSISIIILIKHWKSSYVKGLWVLILFCILGIPIGLIFLKKADDRIVKVVLAVIIIMFSSLNLAKPNYFRLKTNKLAWIFGIISGILGGAYNTNGPPVIIYGKLKGWEPANFRAILQTVFLPTNLFIIIGQGTAGFWSHDVLKYFLYALPVLILGTITGGIINKRLSSEKFAIYVDLLLIAVGIILMVKTLF